MKLKTYTKKAKENTPEIRMYCNLLFDNDTDMEETSREIGLTPNEYMNKKEQQKSPFKDDNLEGFWTFKIGGIKTYNLEDITKIMVDTLNPFLPKIKQTIKRYEGRIDFLIVPELHHNYKPALSFNRDFLDIVHFLNATIQIDYMYID